MFIIINVFTILIFNLSSVKIKIIVKLFKNWYLLVKLNLLVSTTQNLHILHILQQRIKITLILLFLARILIYDVNMTRCYSKNLKVGSIHHNIYVIFNTFTNQVGYILLKIIILTIIILNKNKYIYANINI